MRRLQVKTNIIEKLKDEFRARNSGIRKRIVVCAGTGCVANGALKVFNALSKAVIDFNANAEVTADAHTDKPECGTSISGCQGFCQMGPLVNIEPEGILYVKVNEADVAEIVDKTIKRDIIVERLLYKDPRNGCKHKGRADIPFYSKQKRFTLDLCGILNPEDIAEYASHDGYRAAEKCLTSMKSEEICAVIDKSGLRGRGGGGFPTGRKWELTRKEKSNKKYVICNGDEGDPGAFMDRSIMEGNPHAVIEGMMIAALGIGADEGYVYVRAEYPLAVKRMRKALADAKTAGIIGDNIFGSGKSFNIIIMEGAGAFVCGEETALMASIMGRRGMPSPKPPFPAQRGLHGRPTVINNVETLATVPKIMLIGADEFRRLGTVSSPGTKTFALTGHVANTGLIEVPFGTTLREIIFSIGGGVTGSNGKIDDAQFKAVQIGGPSGGCLVKEHLDLPLDFESLKSIGAMVGSGGLVVMNQATCIPQIAKFFMQFAQNESCGKCVPCREGTRQMLALLEDITEGKADMETLKNLEALALVVQKASLCGLGKTAPNPVLSTLRHFREEYEAHVNGKSCPAKQCKALTAPGIDPAKCAGCGICAKKCPAEAISGQRKTPYAISAAKCVRCGICAEACKFNAIFGV
jgi:NADH-quinone oxidoreductase subunit F